MTIFMVYSINAGKITC